MDGFNYFFKFSWKVNKKYIISLIIKVIATNFIGIIILILPQFLIDSIIETNYKYIAIWGAITVISNFFGNMLIEYYTADVYIQKNIVYNKFQLWLAEKQGKTKYEYIERDEVKTLYEQGSKYIYGFQGSQGFGSAFETFFDLWGYIFTAVTVAIMIAYLNMYLLIVVVFVTCTMSLVRNHINQLVYETNMKKVPYERKENYFKMLFSDYRYGKEIRINNILKFFLNKAQINMDRTNYYYKLNIDRYKWASFVGLFLNFLQDICVYITLIKKVLTSEISIGNFTMYLNAVSKFSSNLMSITKSFLKIKEYSLYYAAFKKYLDIIEKEEKEDEKDKCLSTDNYNLEFRNVYFKYSDKQNYILKNINFVVKSGTHVALVGNNGSGKTTLIKLIARLYEPTSGEILLNGINIKLFKREDYYKKLAVVFQDYKIFPISLKENICFGKEFNSRKVHNMMRSCAVDKFLEKCRTGFDTQLSREFDESGVEPSGGESQKICLVRALYKDAACLILDEPTAALDPRAEFEIFKMFKEAIKDKTAILISHRLGMAKLCDEIIVLNEGKIIEKGNHNDLLKLQGIYYEMYKKQSVYYK